MTCKLDNTIVGRYLSLQDNEFVECVSCDVQFFVSQYNDNASKSVLVFPPVNNYRRFLIHKVVEERSQHLSTFSIGQGHARRTVVCFKRQLLKKPVSQNENETVTVVMGVDHHLGSSANSTALSHETATKRAKAMPAVNIYRPPAARKLQEQVFTSSVPAATPEKLRSGKPRRPDIQVYVPRAKRLEVSRKCALGLTRSDENMVVQDTSEDSCKTRCSELSEKLKENKKNQQNTKGKFSSHSHVLSNSSAQHTEPQPPLNSSPLNNKKKTEHQMAAIKLSDPPSSSHVVDSEQQAEDVCVTSHPPVPYCTPLQSVYANVEKNNEHKALRDPQTVETKQHTEGRFKPDVLIISDPPESCFPGVQTAEEKNEQQVEEGRHSSNAIISDPPKACTIGLQTVDTGTEKKTEQQAERPPQMCETSTKKQQLPLNLNPDECTWDMLFDDNGDCLDPKLMEELTSAVGSVTIEKPQSDYRSYQNRVEMMLSGNVEDEFAHVLEIYNFPPEFKTQDLFTVFSPYMKNGFEIKWVDDTHALGVFSSALIAAEVLAADHPFVKTRPLHLATPESRMKARRSAEFLQPYRARPETCAAMARRLVTGALGVRLTTSPEEREAERRMLKEARERKRLAARQRDEAWEGTLMSNK